jgi:hypothetical protein
MAALEEARSKLRRSVFPSMATTSPCVTSEMASTHRMKQREKVPGSSAARTRPKVSWDGNRVSIEMRSRPVGGAVTAEGGSARRGAVEAAAPRGSWCGRRTGR